MPHQIHHEDDAPAQNTSEQEVLAGIIVVDLVAQFLDTLLKGLFIDQDLGDDILVVLHSLLLWKFFCPDGVF